MADKESWVKQFYALTNRMPEADEYAKGKASGFDVDQIRAIAGLPAEDAAQAEKPTDAEAPKASAGQTRRSNKQPAPKRPWLIPAIIAGVVVIVGIGFAVKMTSAPQADNATQTSSKTNKSADKSASASKKAAASSKAAAESSKKAASSAAAASAAKEKAAAALAAQVKEGLRNDQGKAVIMADLDDTVPEILHSNFYQKGNTWYWQLTGHNGVIKQNTQITGVKIEDDYGTMFTVANVADPTETYQLHFVMTPGANYHLTASGIVDAQFIINSVDVGNLTTQQAEDWAWHIFNTGNVYSRDDYTFDTYLDNKLLRIDIYQAEDEDHITPYGSYAVDGDGALVDGKNNDIVIQSYYQTDDVAQ